MFFRQLATALLLSGLVCFTGAQAQDDEPAFSSSTFDGLELRSVGPAFMSGRIADIAIHPDDPNIWYVGVGSGGVWKTVNAGTTWESIFDDQDVYSIGCVTIDPANPHTIWVGTGENVGGRHVSFGDGIYRSRDGGESWENMGLGESEHISRIIVSPDDSNTLWVASQGPLWSAGGDRGVFKSTDGGATWNKTLGDEDWTGVTDLLIDPRDANRLYAATWQHHRTVAGYMGGGPGTGIYRSDDGGDTWEGVDRRPARKRHGKDRLGHFATESGRTVRGDHAGPAYRQSIPFQQSRRFVARNVGHRCRCNGTALLPGTVRKSPRVRSNLSGKCPHAGVERRRRNL